MSFTIRTLIFLGFAAISLISVLSGYFTYVNIQHTNESFQQIIDYDTPRIQSLLELKNLATEIELNVVSFQLAQGAEESTLAEPIPKKDQLLENLELLTTWGIEYKTRVYENGNLDAQFFDSFTEIKSSIFASSLAYIDAQEQNEDMASLILKKEAVTADISSLETLIKENLEQEFRDLEMQKNVSKVREKDSLLISVLLTTVGFLITILFWLSIRTLLVLPLRGLRQAAVAVSEGKFNHVKVYRQDEIGIVSKAFNHMIDTLLLSRRRLEEEAEIVKSKSVELDAKVSELERLNNFMVNREIKMLELKKENELLKKRRPEEG